MPRPVPSRGSDGQVQRPTPMPSRPQGSTGYVSPKQQQLNEGREARPMPIRRPADRSLAPTVNRLNYYPGTRIIIPPAWHRCTVMPDMGYWGRRDIMAEIQWMARSGSIPVTPLSGSVEELADYVQVPSGWRAYGIPVPVGGTVQVEVKHGNLGWFRLMLVDKWGQPGPGMLQAAIAHQPVLVTYKNPGKEATAIYVIVDDPAWWSDEKNPYTLQIRRDWDPATADLSRVQMVEGLWGSSPSVSAQFRRPTLTGPAVYPR